MSEMNDDMDEVRKARLIHELAEEFDPPPRKATPMLFPVFKTSLWPAKFHAFQFFLGARRRWALWINFIS
jgi:hypothetical protein